jgi:SAM-dependent methyltransferase
VDPDAHRSESRERWERAAAGWKARGDVFQAAALPVSHRMIDAIAPQPGQVLLELAAGPGETGLLAAELLRPGGRLISTDGAEAMVEIARERARALGLADVVEARPMELEWIDLGAAEVDGLLNRFGLMHAVDPEAALREARRVLRRDGRAALAVWDEPDANPWLAAIGQELAAMGRPDPQADGPGAFALSAPGRLADLLYGAGFAEVEVEPVDLTFEAPSADGWWDVVMELSSSLPAAVAQLSPAEHYRLREAVEGRWQEHAAPDGTLRIPGRALVAGASA